MRSDVTSKSIGALAAWLIVLSPGIAQAQSGRAVTNWTCSCPRGPVEVPNSMNGPAPDCRRICNPGGSADGSSGSLTSMQTDLARQVGGVLGSMLREALFGNPQQANRADQEQAVLRQATEEEERRREAMRNRMLSMMRGADGQFVGGGEGAAGARMSFRFDESSFGSTLAQVPANSAIAQLTRALYFSEQATRASRDEEVAELAGAAFDSSLGVMIDLPVPPGIAALPVSDADADRLELLRKDYREVSAKAQETAQRLAEAEERREIAERLLAEASARVRTARRNLAQAKTAAERQSWEKELSSARATLRDANAFARSAAAQLANARDELGRSYSSVQTSAHQVLNTLTAYRSDSAYLRGLLDGSTCMSSNAELSCATLPTKRAACVENYTNGYRIGERAKEQKLRQAHHIGEEAKQARNSMIGFNHPKSSGPCRVRWLQAFYSGYGGYPFATVDR